MPTCIRVGQKLYPEDLINRNWQQKFGEPSMVLSLLNECGISFVEFPVSEKSDPELIIGITKLCKNEGLFVSLQTDSESSLSPACFNKEEKHHFETFLSLANEIGNISGEEVPCVFKCPQECRTETEISTDQEIHNARLFFRWVSEAVCGIYSNVIPLCGSLSTNKSKQNIPVNSWKSCLKLVEGTDISFCWDFGDSFGSENFETKIPDDHFISRVHHVLAYDSFKTEVGIETNFPLGEGLIPWRNYCAALARHAYDETVLLDVNPSIYRDFDDMLFFTRDGIEKLAYYF